MCVCVSERCVCVRVCVWCVLCVCELCVERVCERERERERSVCERESV